MPSLSNSPVIFVRNLTKTYRVPERESGLGASLKSMVRRSYQDVKAVQEISFSIQAGEMVGFIGPNGAGKTTTLKMLAGILYPSEGAAQVLGHIPWKRETAYLRRISIVLGNKSQMLWDIPPLDTFGVLGEIYSLPAAEYRNTLDELVDLLGMEEVLKKPVRNLSLGERMKCELVAGLLHRPAVLFLDEPTLGLDISIQRRVRDFLCQYNQRYGVTVLLTSHYMADVMALCPRVILIHHGKLLYDGRLDGLAQQLAPFKLVRLTLNHGISTTNALDLPPNAEIIEQENSHLTLRVDREAAPSAAAYLLDKLAVTDLTIEDPPIEAVMDQVYQEGNV
ncbi:MAG: ATP-binding cassette domain-containing protein [Anaerolineales bacterium]|nr:ATP-binding cassette domain-containing protein [Anaerolineales bacterium]